MTDEETDDPPPYSPIKEPHPQWQDKSSHVESVLQVSPSVESVPQVSPTPPCSTALYPALPSKESLDHALSAVKFYWSYQEYAIIFLPTCPLTKIYIEEIQNMEFFSCTSPKNWQKSTKW